MYLMGQGPDGQPIPISVNADGEIVVRDSAARTPIQATVALSAVRVNLGTVSSAESLAGWDLVADGDWLIGTSGAQLRPVLSGEAFTIPSSTLAGWYAKSAGTPTLVLTGAQ